LLDSLLQEMWIISLLVFQLASPREINGFPGYEGREDETLNEGLKYIMGLHEAMRVQMEPVMREAMHEDSETRGAVHEAMKTKMEPVMPDESSNLHQPQSESEHAQKMKSVIEERYAYRDQIILGDKRLNMQQGRDVSANVLVLGAGMAGITAAKTLQDLGVDDVKIVEGSDRLGGRVKDVPFGGINVEVGANWVHFANMNHSTKNPIEDMVREAGLNFVDDDYSDFIFRYKGQNVTEEAMVAMDRLDHILDYTVNLADKKKQRGEPDVNFRVALRLGDWRPVTPVERAVEFFNFDFEFSDEPSDTGLMDNVGVFRSHGKDDMFVADKRGYSTVIDNVARKLHLQENVNLFLNDYVTKISYNEPGEFKVKIESINKKTGRRNTYRSNYVIVTFSIGVLESDFVEFVPSLPPWKEEIIYMYKMTRYIKIFVKFPSHITAFWDDNHYIMYCDPTNRGHYQVWQNLEARGKYFPRGTNMLLATVMGNNWDRVQHLSKEEVMRDLYNVLRNMYGDKAVYPEDILIPDWHSNPLFFGSYSNWPIGVSMETYQNLDAPVGRLYFAGEACSKDYPGYLHGAMQSGELTARNLHKCMVEKNCEAVPEQGYGYSNACSNKHSPVQHN